MKLTNLHAVVVGGATAGAGAALLLARAGARVTLIERVPNPRAVGAGIAIAENGLAVLESIGLGPAIRLAARPVEAPRVVDGRGRALVGLADEVPRVVMIRRSALQQILLDAIAAERGIDRLFGAEVIASDRRGGVEVRTEWGPRHVQGDLVIGADGVHSRIRDVGDHGAKVRTGITYVRGLVDGDLARGEEAWTAAGLFGSFAVAPHGTYFYCSVGGRAARRALANRDLAGFRAAWARAYAPAGELLGAIERFDQLLVNQVRRVECARWFDGRQVLVGDAAHAMAPNLGQGANSALVDVAVLLDELRGAKELTAAFAAYQARRQPAVAKVARAAARLGALAELTNPVARWLRDRLVLPLATRLASPAASTTTVLQEPTETLLAIGRA